MQGLATCTAGAGAPAAPSESLASAGWYTKGTHCEHKMGCIKYTSWSVVLDRLPPYVSANA